jgi:hypothetical protein
MERFFMRAACTRAQSTKRIHRLLLSIELVQCSILEPEDIGPGGVKLFCQFETGEAAF